MSDADLYTAAARDALAAENQGFLTDAVIAAAERANRFNLRVPIELGGADLGLVDAFHHIEALSYADGGAGWTLSFMALASALVSAFVPDAGAEEIAAATGGRWPRFAGTFPYSGTATPVEGGYRVTGRWGFASGIHHAQWLAAGCRVAASDGLLWIAVPATSAQIEPGSWDVDGLRGTGSCTYRLDDVFVPHRRVFSVAQPSQARGRADHRLPTLVYITPEHAGVALGLARRALDEALHVAQGKLRLGGRLALGEREAFLRDLGRAQTAWRAARALVVERLEHAAVLAEAGPPFAPELTLDVRSAAAHAADVATDVAALAYRYGGGSVVARTHPLHRAWRDVMTATQHVHVNDEVYVSWAGTLATAESPSAGRGAAG